MSTVQVQENLMFEERDHSAPGTSMQFLLKSMFIELHHTLTIVNSNVSDPRLHGSN